MSDSEFDRTQEPARFSDIPLLLFIRGLFFVSLVSLVLVSAHWYIGLRLIRDAGLPPAAWTVLWGAFASIFISLIGGRLLPRSVGQVLQWVGFLWIGAFAMLLTACAATDLGFFVASFVAPRTSAWGPLQAGLIMALVVPALAWGFLVARRTPKVERVTVPIRGLGKAFDGLRIVQITDVHIGDTLDGSFLRRVVDAVNALKPDVIAVTGDLIDGSVASLRAEVAALKDLKASRGTFYVTGNHEYYHGAAAWLAEVKRLGLTVLHNEHRVLEHDGAKLVVAGVPDLEGARFAESHAPRADVAFAGAPKDAPRILLAHQPRFARHAKDQKVQLMLSGHTHGGQIFPFMFFVRLQQPVIAGFRTLHGVPVYTSRGTGYWGPPFRVGPSSEITELTLRVQPDDAT
jgi:predicted MPP superfamily phosphohydrolase